MLATVAVAVSFRRGRQMSLRARRNLIGWLAEGEGHLSVILSALHARREGGREEEGRKGRREGKRRRVRKGEKKDCLDIEAMGTLLFLSD